MNLRQLKKACKKAQATLVNLHGIDAAHFTPSDGEDDAVLAPPKLNPRNVRRGLVYPSPLKGTPLFWTRNTLDDDDWDCDLPSELLQLMELLAKEDEQERAP